MEWIDIPAHKILKLTADEFQDRFVFVCKEGSRLSWKDMQQGRYMAISSDEYKIFRIKDDKQFRAPRYHHDMADFGRIIFLEEV